MSVQCAACGERFGGMEAFDRHRVRVPRNLDPDPPSNRCANADEMAARGLVQDDNGVWRGEGPIAKARKAWRRIEGPFSRGRSSSAGRKATGKGQTPDHASAGLRIAISGVSA